MEAFYAHLYQFYFAINAHYRTLTHIILQNRQNIQEKNEIDHNSNMELSILNIEIPLISVFF